MKLFLRILFIVTLFSGSVMAQPGFQDDEDPGIPIDGGVGALLVAGAAWGIKKLKEKK